MDSKRRLYEFYQDCNFNYYRHIVSTPSNPNILFYQYDRTGSGLDDYLKLRNIDWKDKFLLHNNGGVCPIPYIENGEVYTVLGMPNNILYLAGMDIKFNKVREETKGKIKIEPVRHLLLDVPHESIKTYARIVKTKRLTPLTPAHLLKLQQDKALLSLDTELILWDLVRLMIYLWSQGVQGLRNAIFLDQDNELTFIPFNHTCYSHYGQHTMPIDCDDLVILSSFTLPELNLSKEMTEALNQKEWGLELDFNDRREGLQEFELPDVKLSPEDHKKFADIYRRSGAQGIRPQQQLAEMLSTLISLGLQDEIRLDLSKYVDDGKSINTILIAIERALFKVYLKNLELTKYLRPPIYHFVPELLELIDTFANFPLTNYQAVRNQIRNSAKMNKKLEHGDKADIRYNVGPRLMEGATEFISRRFSKEQEKESSRQKRHILSEEHKKVNFIGIHTAEYNLIADRAFQRYISETYVGRVKNGIIQSLSQPQVPLYVLNISHRKTVINGIEFSTYDLSCIFFETPLFSELEFMTLSGFNRSDLKLIKDFLTGRKPITSLYRDLSLSAYNQLSLYGSLLSTLEIPELRQLWCKMFVLGLPVVEQIKQNKSMILDVLTNKGYEYLVQRIELV